MGKIIFILSLWATFMQAEGLQSNTLYDNCLKCHQEQQIPNNLIYKRYLMKYSTDDRMEKAMFAYLKDPKKEHSIMPAPFFLKFPMKKALELDDAVLKNNIKSYLEKYNMKKKLILEK